MQSYEHILFIQSTAVLTIPNKNSYDNLEQKNLVNSMKLSISFIKVVI